MKKILVILFAAVLALALVACQPADDTSSNGDTSSDADASSVVEDSSNTDDSSVADTSSDDTDAKSEGVMTYEQFVAAELNGDVVIETYVQATQSWWEKDGQGVITVYTQDHDGAYFLYEMACSQEDAAKLTKGTKIKVTGVKGEWEGEVEVMDATFEFVDDGKTYVAEATDITSLLGTDDLIKHQNQFVSFKGVTIKSVTYKNGEPGDDIYVTVTYGENDYDFCVESYLMSPETDTYKAFADLAEGDKVDIEGFLYWYKGVNTHITSVAKVTE